MVLQRALREHAGGGKERARFRAAKIKAKDAKAAAQAHYQRLMTETFAEAAAWSGPTAS